jgi:hypothetical protein
MTMDPKTRRIWPPTAKAGGRPPEAGRRRDDVPGSSTALVVGE